MVYIILRALIVVLERKRAKKTKFNSSSQRMSNACSGSKMKAEDNKLVGVENPVLQLTMLKSRQFLLLNYTKNKHKYKIIFHKKLP